MYHIMYNIMPRYHTSQQKSRDVTHVAAAADYNSASKRHLVTAPTTR